MRVAPAFQDNIRPSRFLLTIASSEDSTIAASHARRTTSSRSSTVVGAEPGTGADLPALMCASRGSSRGKPVSRVPAVYVEHWQRGGAVVVWVQYPGAPTPAIR